MSRSLASNEVRTRTPLIMMSPIMRICWLVLVCSAALAQAPDTVIYSAKIFSSVPGRPFVQAIAIRGQRIVAIGADDAILRTAAASTRKIDAGGRVVIPGFNDAHTHLGASLPSTSVGLSGQEPSWEEVRSALARAVEKTAEGPLLTATIGARVFEDSNVDRKTLDAISSVRPIRLSAWTGHGAILNSPALRLYGIREDQPDPPGGWYGRDTNKRLDGHLYEYAALRLSGTVDPNRAAQAWDAVTLRAAEFGLTSIQNMTFEAERDRALFAQHPPRIRIRINTMLANWNDSAKPPAEPHEPIKLIVDGSPVEHFAAMLRPYSDDARTSGRLNVPETELCGAIRNAVRNGRQLMLHVVGDRAVEVALNCMERQSGVDWPRQRVRFEHGDMVTPEMFARVRKLGVIVVQNPSHFTIGDVLIARWGRDRAAVAQSARSLIAAGIPFALGSDGPMNPFVNIMLACMHPGRPSEGLTREQAVQAYTQTSAFAEFAEDQKGTLEIGKLADLAILSQDIFSVPLQELPKTRSLLTMVGGKVIYEAKIGG